MSKSVLIVEDYEDTRSMMKFMIENFGYTVIEAGGPYEAIEKANEFMPDLILMDIGLPLMDGLSVTRMIKDSESTAGIPIIAVTAFSDIREQALDAGCADVLYKPVEFPQIKRMLDKQLDGH